MRRLAQALALGASAGGSSDEPLSLQPVEHLGVSNREAVECAA